MPNKTSIEWTDFSSQLIRYRNAAGKDVWACVKTSPGCARCYSESLAKRFDRGGPFNQVTMRGITPYFAEDEAKKIIRSRVISGRRVFIGDMTDVFGEWVPDGLLDLMFAVFAMRPDVTFQVLTKRAERMARYFNERDSHFREYTEPAGPWPLPNVWLGVSCEDQARADERIPHLLRTPAVVRFLSCEPLIGPVDLSRWVFPFHPWANAGGPDECPHGYAAGIPCPDCTPRLHWVITGGESGPDARPCDLGWIRSIRDQCKSAGVACFVKQLGGNVQSRNDEVSGWFDECGHLDLSPTDRFQGAIGRVRGFRDRKGGATDEWPIDLRIREMPVPAGRA